MTDEARVYCCPACGAPTPELARRCEYCRAPIATVRCGWCFQMNVPEAQHCGGCGRELGLQPIAAHGDPAECPDCRCTLLCIRETAGVLFDCGECGGQFVEHPLLQALLSRQPRELGGLQQPRIKPRNPLTQRVSYRACPICRTLMLRKNFGLSSGVILDVCSRHGVWFDRGELSDVLAFVESGGLERARELELERARQTETGRRIARQSQSEGMSLAGWREENADFGAAIRALRDFLVELLKRD